uniref:Essential protein Yae1 N-terminal domain-containing protein n=1 Tax=Ditylum brightwellii TaxID=49249 RepID=A0A7S4QPX7_9STRA
MTTEDESSSPIHQTTTTTNNDTTNNNPNNHNTSSSSSSKNNNNNNDWDDICLNPFDSSYQTGRTEGYNAGLNSGFKEGQTLGRHKGLEIGIELGFIRGFVTVALEKALIMKEEDNNNNNIRVEKVKKGLQELLIAIDTFPSPDTLFQRADDGGGGGAERINVSNDTNLSQHTDKVEKEVFQSNSSSTAAAPMDVTVELQRIRAKFKLITVQLRIQQFSLKRIMDNVCVVASSSSSNVLEQGGNINVGGEKNTLQQHGGHDW